MCSDCVEPTGSGLKGRRSHGALGPLGMPRDTVSFPTGLLRVALNSSFIEPRRLVGCRNHPEFSCKDVPHYPITVSVMPHFCTICGVFLSPAQVGPGDIPNQGLEWHQTLRLGSFTHDFPPSWRFYSMPILMTAPP